jgi:transposase-like protein
MSIITLQIPEVKYARLDRPARCPYCPGETFQRWGGVSKPVRDPHLSEVWVYRYRCCRCKRTFRHYPQGVGPADQTQRLATLVALLWVLGVSYRGLVRFLAALGVSLERMSAWRDVQAQAERLARQNHWGRVRILGLDGAYVRGWGQTHGVLVAVDLGTGQPVALGYVNEQDPRAVRRFLEPLVQRLGVSVLVTDDLESYKVVAEQLELEQQVCQFHVRRWVGRTLRELAQTVPQDWGWVVEEVARLIAELPPEGARRLVALARQLPVRRAGRRDQPWSPLERLRDLLVRLAQDWAKYRLFDTDPGVPWTNNGTERAIGRMKMRARTVRGYQTWPGMENALLLSGTRLG